MNVLEINELTKKYKNQRGVENVSVSIKDGEVIGLLGPNGCGKTTAMKAIAGLVTADSGSISLFGINPLEDRTVMSKVGCLIEAPAFYPYLTAEENLKILLRLYPSLTSKRMNEVLEMVGLTQYKDEKVCKFSFGMKQKLGICNALFHNPKLLILDEPTNGLDIGATADLRRILKGFKNNGGSVLISSHIAGEIEKICSTIIVMSEGSVIGTKSINEITMEYGSLEEYYIAKIKSRKGNAKWMH